MISATIVVHPIDISAECNSKSSLCCRICAIMSLIMLDCAKKSVSRYNNFVLTVLYLLMLFIAAKKRQLLYLNIEIENRVIKILYRYS